MKLTILLIALAAANAKKDCSHIIPDKAIHWAEFEATKNWGPYLAQTPTKMTQEKCIAACEANTNCAGWA